MNKTAEQLNSLRVIEAHIKIMDLLNNKYPWLLNSEAIYLTTKILRANQNGATSLIVNAEDLTNCPKTGDEYTGSKYQMMLRELKADIGIEIFVSFRHCDITPGPAIEKSSNFDSSVDF